MRPIAACFVAVLALCPLLAIAADAPVASDDRWAEAMRRFEQADREQPFPKGEIVFTGSSSIRLWNLEESFPGIKALNRGFGGSQIPDAVRHLDLLVLRHRPQTVVLFSGGNDINAGRTPEQVIADFQSFVSGIHSELPDTTIVAIGIKPTIDRWDLADKMRQVNRGIQKHCEATDGCEFVDVWPAMLGEDGKPRKELFVKDGLHLSPKGYALWTKLVRPHLTSPVPATSGSAPSGTSR